MKFNSFKELVDKINQDIGTDFCSQFQYKRKKLTGQSRTASRHLLFGNIKDEDGWAINEGGGMEVQYHVQFQDEENVKYGLGFNTQYVPFANEKSPVEYVRPFMRAFVEREETIRKLLPEYDFVEGDRERLIHPMQGQYTLFGSSIPVLFDNGSIEMPDLKYAEMLENLKKQQTAYELIFKTRNRNIILNFKMENLIDLIQLKGQIILQGPPGTGKTRKSKELALELIKNNPVPDFSPDCITEHLQVGKIIPTSNSSSSFTINRIGDNKISVRPVGGENEYEIRHSEIADAFARKMWLGGIAGGIDTYKAGLAKYLFTQEQFRKYCSLVQFHPSYSYEDFVRGINVQTENGHPVYETNNRILGEMAEQALTNYKNHHKPSDQLSHEKWVLEKMKLFRQQVNLELSHEGKYWLTEKVYVYNLDEYSFRYKGDGWTSESRVRYEDFFQLILVNLDNWNQEPVISETVSVHASYRQSYYAALLKKFFAFSGKFEGEQSTHEELKKYVLIIDEINRANLPAVLGELIYALEYRGEEVQGLYKIKDSNSFILPPNLYIIGTMNTADRSVGHIDYAIRRRFAFVDILPQEDVIPTEAGKELYRKVRQLFIKSETSMENSVYLASDFHAKDVMPGHSYFMDNDAQRLKIRMKYEVVPLLEEYIKDGVLSGETRLLVNELLND